MIIKIKLDNKILELDYKQAEKAYKELDKIFGKKKGGVFCSIPQHFVSSTIEEGPKPIIDPLWTIYL